MLSQMNMFKRKGPSPEELIRETNLKRHISKEFSRILKLLQQRHMNADDPIYSDDDANSLCNILEAVFLHGLKDSITTKLVNYVNFASQVPDNRITVNFWNFVVKFTHKDVVSQLKELPQITSDIGLCRAWVRLALNDGLMESYLHSVIADSKTLQYYYHTTAYLRDHEQPGILKSYLSGLMTLTFQLSYNSSVLNDWTSTPLVLSGLVDSQTSTPIVNVRAGNEKKSASEDKTSLQPPRTVRAKSRDLTKTDGAEIVDNQHETVSAPSNMPNSMQGFTRAEMEAIKNLTMASSPYNASECSSSSHISCPDPSNGTAPSLDPTLIENQILQEIMAQNAADLKRACDGKSLNPLQDRRSKLLAQDKKTKNDKKSPTLPIKERHEKEQNYTDKETNIKPSRESEVQRMQEKPEEEVLVPVSVASNPDISEIDLNSESCDTLVGESQDPPVNINPEEKDDGNVSYSLYDKYDTPDLTLKPTDPLETIPDLSPLNEQELPPLDPCPPSVSPRLRNSDSLEAEISPADEENPEKAEISDRLSITAVQDISIRTDLQSTPQNSDEVTEENGLTGSPRSIGNKLCMMTGWSSEFEHSGEYLSQRNLALFESSTEENKHTEASRTESFRTLLKNYAPQNSTSPGPSLEQVIENLPESASVSDGDAVDSAQLGRVMKTQFSEEQVEDGFEVVETVPEMSSFDSSSNPGSRLAHFKSIAVEKGLDSQNYQCKGCTRPVGLIYGNPRVCNFDGGYYCFECHENDEYCIPAYVIFNWDFRKHKVSRVSRDYLQQMEDQPVLDLEDLNPRIYEFIPEIEEIRVLRQQLCSLKTYLFSCHQDTAVELRKKVWPREHMYDSRHLYSLADLLQIPSGQLSRFLKDVVKFASKHVYDCSLCCQKGFICEVCNNSKVIYPFEVETTYRCQKCKAVYHKTCMTENLPCPKCTRWRQRKTSYHESPADSEDYAITPP